MFGSFYGNHVNDLHIVYSYFLDVTPQSDAAERAFGMVKFWEKFAPNINAQTACELGRAKVNKTMQYWMEMYFREPEETLNVVNIFLNVGVFTGLSARHPIKSLRNRNFIKK